MTPVYSALWPGGGTAGVKEMVEVVDGLLPRLHSLVSNGVLQLLQQHTYTQVWLVLTLSEWSGDRAGAGQGREGA